MTLSSRVRALEALFGDIAATRMAGLPVCHPALHVQAVGFAPDPASGGALGVLITPWFMNLVWLPAIDPLPGDRQAAVAARTVLPVGASRVRMAGSERFEFIGAREEGFGAFEACSLFSPMAEFATQAGAVATAEAVLSLLREAPAGAPPMAADAVPARRRFLLGGGGARA